VDIPVVVLYGSISPPRFKGGNILTLVDFTFVPTSERPPKYISKSFMLCMIYAKHTTQSSTRSTKRVQKAFLLEREIATRESFIL